MKAKLLLLFVAMSAAMVALQSSAQSFKARPDTIFLIPGIADTVDLLANDLIPPGDSIQIEMVHSNPVERLILLPGRQLVVFFPRWLLFANGKVEGNYILRRKNTTDTSGATLTFFIRDESYDSLMVNNINARFMAMGCHHPIDNTCFEVPKGSGKGTIFSHCLWMGGLDQQNQLHLAAYLYGQGPGPGPSFTKTDFWAGPVMDSAYYTDYSDTIWNYVWKLKKADIDNHIANWYKPGYQPIHDILTWPAHGDVAAGQAYYLAPFIDYNLDGSYNPLDGDYPNIRGDEALWFIYNDDHPHSNTGGSRLTAEIHVMAYGFDIPTDSALNNTIFVNYRIFNRSSNAYSGLYNAIFSDFDIGFHLDDYIGSHVERGMLFGYNGTKVDWAGNAKGYGEHPPAQGIVFLGGPLLPPDQRDNPAYVHGNCDVLGTGYPNDAYAINGAGFGDTIIDNERMGLTRFIMINDFSFLQYFGYPTYAHQYYWLMQGFWIDSTRMIYGGNGHPEAGGYGPACNYLFPGISDYCNWGTGGQIPNGPVLWNEKTAGNLPDDRRGIGITGPYSLAPGESQEIDLAYVFARDYAPDDTSASLNLLGQYSDLVRQSYVTNQLPDGRHFLGMEEKKANPAIDVIIYPNPASSVVYVSSHEGFPKNSRIRIVSVSGIQFAPVPLKENAHSVTVDISYLRPGLYLVVIESEGMTVTRKLSVIR